MQKPEHNLKRRGGTTLVMPPDTAQEVQAPMQHQPNETPVAPPVAGGGMARILQTAREEQFLRSIKHAIEDGDWANDRRFGRPDELQDAVDCLHDARRAVEKVLSA